MVNRYLEAMAVITENACYGEKGRARTLIGFR